MAHALLMTCSSTAAQLAWQPAAHAAGACGTIRHLGKPARQQPGWPLTPAVTSLESLYLVGKKDVGAVCLGRAIVCLLAPLEQEDEPKYGPAAGRIQCL